MSKWEQQLERNENLLANLIENQKKGGGKLRLNKHHIAVSDVAEQYFCEKKVEMHHLHGKLETEAKVIGKEAHEKLLEGTMKIKRRELWKKIHDGNVVVTSETLLLGKYKGTILVGVSDSILFAHGKPLIIFEYKFSRARAPFKDHHVQARTYGVLLRSMGFDIKRLFYAIVIADPEARSGQGLKKKVLTAVANNGPKEAVLSVDGARIYFTKFKREEAEHELDWAIEFWNNRREAVPTSNPNKCRSCEYNTECKAVAKLSSAM
jgi:CRISPR/Cas system-associated exonuclease Cas4 (RecB family)